MLTEIGAPIQGVVVLLRETGNLWNTTVFTGSEGFYIISGIVPGYTFDPSQRNYLNLVQDFTGQDFTANPLP